MMNTYQLSIENNHLMISENGVKMLVDTGSPFTIARSGELSLMGDVHPVSQSLPMVGDVDSLCRLAELEFDCLLGLDVLSQYCMCIDMQGGTLTLSDEPIALDGGTTVALRGGGMYAQIALTIGGKQVNTVIDTGAPTAYVHHDISAGLASEGEREDFNPMLGGRFTTPIFSLDAEVAGLPFALKAGNLSSLESMMAMMGFTCVVGADLLKAFTVVFDFKNRQFILRPSQQ
ncbi:MAG: hypothetical protein Q4B68_00125 [Bacteroidales bacterium]|nr:hypothetical protein [Bacteroidales bacterium]